MNQMIQLGYILILLVGIFGFAMQSMVQVKNLAVTNQLVKGKSTTIFLAIIVLFNGCDFLALFLGNTIGQQGILWILVAENILEILLAYALIEMERNYAMAERNKGTLSFFVIILIITLWIDVTYTTGIMHTIYAVYGLTMIVLNVLPLFAVLYFGIKYFKSIVRIMKYTIVDVFYVFYNMIFIVLCLVTTISILDSRTPIDYIRNDKLLHVAFWLVFNILNGIFIWKSCKTVEGSSIAVEESAADKIQRLAETYKFSERELEIAKLLCKGKNNNEIAGQLFLSPNTIKVHTSNLYKKMGVKNRVQAVQVLRGEEIE